MACQGCRKRREALRQARQALVREGGAIADAAARFGTLQAAAIARWMKGRGHADHGQR